MATAAQLTCADEAGAAAVNQVVVVGQDEGAALLDLQAVLVARHLLLAGAPGGGEKLSAQPGLVGHLRMKWMRKRKRRVSVELMIHGVPQQESHLLMQQPSARRPFIFPTPQTSDCLQQLPQILAMCNQDLFLKYPAPSTTHHPMCFWNQEAQETTHASTDVYRSGGDKTFC